MVITAAVVSEKLVLVMDQVIINKSHEKAEANNVLVHLSILVNFLSPSRFSVVPLQGHFHSVFSCRTKKSILVFSYA